jgi:hypothetical protein
MNTVLSADMTLRVDMVLCCHLVVKARQAIHPEVKSLVFCLGYEGLKPSSSSKSLKTGLGKLAPNCIFPPWPWTLGFVRSSSSIVVYKIINLLNFLQPLSVERWPGLSG